MDVKLGLSHEGKEMNDGYLRAGRWGETGEFIMRNGTCSTHGRNEA